MNTKKIAVEIPEALYDILEIRCNLPLSPSKKDFVARAIYHELLNCELVNTLVVKSFDEEDFY